MTLRERGGRVVGGGEFALSLALAIDGLNVFALATDTDFVAEQVNSGARLMAKHSYSAFSAVGDLFT